VRAVNHLAEPFAPRDDGARDSRTAQPSVAGDSMASGALAVSS
jgi:hypothetical protein